MVTTGLFPKKTFGKKLTIQDSDFKSIPMTISSFIFLEKARGCIKSLFFNGTNYFTPLLSESFGANLFFDWFFRSLSGPLCQHRICIGAPIMFDNPENMRTSDV